MIGGNDVVSNVFTIDDVITTVTAYPVSKGLAGIHSWSLVRDMDCDPDGLNALPATRIATLALRASPKPSSRAWAGQ